MAKKEKNGTATTNLPTIGQPAKILKKAPVLGVPVYKHPSNQKKVTSFFFFDDAGNRINKSDDEHPDGFVNEEAAREWLFDTDELDAGTVVELRFVTRYVK
jgi:hypothetical protein